MAALSPSAFQTYNPDDASSILPGPFSLYQVSVDDLEATQLNVGFTEVDTKANGFDEITSSSALAADLLGDVEPVVIGPGGVLYQTDGHHTFLALIDSSWGASDPMVDVNVIANYSSDTEAQFIAAMEQSNLLYPVDDGVLETVNPSTGAPLPTSLTGLTSDVYRGLEYSILKNKDSKLFAGGSAIPGLDKTAAFYSDFIYADAYREANNGLGLPYLSPYDINLATNWNLTATSATTLPNVGAVTVAQLPGYILATGDSIVITGTISNSTLANGTLDGSKTGTFDESTSFASFDGLRALDLGVVTIGSNAPGFVMQLGADNGATVTLSGSNTYTGGTTILAGTLVINADAALGAASTSSAINLSSIAASVENDNGIIFDSLTEGNGTIEITASITTDRPIAIDGEVANFNLNGYDLTLTGPIVSLGAISTGLSNADGEAGITVEDTSASANGVLILPGSDSNPDFYGDWIISSGTLRVSSDASLGNTAGSIYSIGEIELNGGTLQAGASFTSVRSLFLGGGSTYDTNGYSTVWDGNLEDTQRTLEVVNSSTTSAGSVAFGTFEVNSTATLYVSGGTEGTSVTFTNGIIRDPGATLILNPAGGALGTLGTTAKVFDTSTGAGGTNKVTDGIVSPWMIVDSGTKASTTNPYSFATYGANGFVAATTSTPGVTSNILTSTAGNTVIQSANATATGNLAAYSLSVQSGVSVALGGHTLALGDGTDPAGLILNGAATVSGGTLATGASELVLWLAGSSGTNTLSAELTGSGGLTIAGGLASTAVSKSSASGSGALTIGTATDETGAVTIGTGLVTLSAANALFSAAPGVTLDNTKTAPSPADLTITANNQFTALQSDGNNSVVTIGNGAALTIGDTTNNLSSVLDSQITETGTGVAGAITKDGSGLLDLSGANGVTLTAGGTVVVNGGALRIANAIFSTSATSVITLAAGTELQYAGNGGSKFNDPIQGQGAFHLLGGTVELTGTNIYSGGTYIENGATLDVTTASLPNGGNVYNAGGILDFDQSTSGVFTGVMSDGVESGGPNDLDDMASGASGPALSGTLIKDDSSGANSGNLTLGAVQTYSGATYVEAGTLTLGVANAIADSSGVTLGRVGFASTATLALGASNTVAALSSDTGSTTTVTLNGYVLTIDPTAGGSATFGGTIADGSATGGAVVIDGAGTEILSGTSSFAGGVTLESGTLGIGSHDAAGTGAITFAAAAVDPTILVSAADTPANGATFENTLANFGDNDELDIAGLTYGSGATATYSAATGQLAVSSNGETIYFNLSGAVAPEYYVHEDSNGDALVNDSSVACYCRGTRIRTPRGDVAVENLQIGDRVVTWSGEAMPLKWVGRRSYAGWIAEANRDIQPIRFRPGSLGDHMPTRDLLVSPEHAMFLDGVLIPARLLLNGVSIVQADPMEDVEYFHLEFAEHTVIVAEGALSESFVDDHSREMFHNAHAFRALYPNAPRGGLAKYCAPRVEEGYALDSVRRRLATRAARLLPSGVASAAATLRGCLDVVTRTSVEGWAFDPAAPDTPVELAIFDNGAMIGRVTADRFRPDLAAAGIGDGRHGFRSTLPFGFAGGVDHAVEIHCAKTGSLIRDEPVVLRAALDPVPPSRALPAEAGNRRPL